MLDEDTPSIAHTDEQNYDYLLTTFDNPFDPFTEWDAWYQWDMSAGYHTPGLLARIAQTSEEISDADLFLAIDKAMDEIVRENVSGMHRKVKPGDVAKLRAQSSE